MKTYFFLLLLCVAVCPTIFGQQNVDSFIIKTSQIQDETPINKQLLYFVDSTNAMDINLVAKQKFHVYPTAKSTWNIPTSLITKTIYFSFSLANEKEQADTLIFFPGTIFKSIIFFKKDSLSNYNLFDVANASSGYPQFILPAKSTSSLLVKLRFCKTINNFIYPALIEPAYEDTFKKILFNRRSDVKTFGFILSGILLIMIFFTGANYLSERKKSYLYYSLYSICIFILVFLHAYMYKHSGVFSNLFFGYLDFCMLLIGSIFYIAFARHFLETKIKFKNLDKLFKIEERFLLISLLVYTFLHFFTANFWMEDKLANYLKITMLLFGVVYIVMAFKERDRLMNYLAIGNSLSILFSAISLYLIVSGIRQSNLFVSAIFYYEIGLTLALIFFLIGLIYKNKKELVNKIQAEEALKLESEKQKYETEIAVIKAQQLERNRISADMHDDLGAGMTSIRLYSELAKNKLAGQQMPEIEKISSSANELLTKMNAIIWSMTSANDSLENMIAYLRSYAIEYFENTGVKCITDLPDEIPYAEVSGEIRRNVFLVVKEALNNVLKHSGATQVVLKLVAKEKVINLYIQDNGKGIDFDNLRQFSNGLKNMKKRMDDVEIDFKIENNNGTLITITREIRG